MPHASGVKDSTGRLAAFGVPAFMFHEGDDLRAAAAFREIARITGGAYSRFDASSPDALRQLLCAVAVYAAGGGSGLFTIDLADPLSPKEAGLLPLDGFQYDVKIANGRLYTAGAWGGVHVLDIASPLNPVKVANAYTPGWAMALAADGNNLLVLDGADGALLYGIAGVQPVRMSAITLSGYMAAGTLNGTSAFVIDREKGLIAIDYSQKSQPRFISRWMPLMPQIATFPLRSAC